MSDDSVVEKVEVALQQWADWSRGGVENLGYPSRSPVHKLMREGAGASGGFGPRRLDVPELVERTEAAVVSLPARQREALRLKYLWIGGRDQERAKKLRMSYDSYKREVERARWYVGGKLF